MKHDSISRGDLFVFNAGINSGSVQNGVRPVIVLQNDNLNRHSPTVIIAPLTSVLKKTRMNSHVVLGRRYGLLRPSMVLLEQIQTIPKDKLLKKIGHVSDDALSRIDIGMSKMLGIKCNFSVEDFSENAPASDTKGASA